MDWFEGYFMGKNTMVLKSQEDTENAALEQRLEAIEALLGVLKSAQPKDVKEAADAAANKAVATVANKTKIKAAKRSKVGAVGGPLAGGSEVWAHGRAAQRWTCTAAALLDGTDANM
ncbi:unnamed protein product [Cladocopium goreaui]|uniref:Uncharacterized protein n=1 Tax=Cladocopium goreaui TaxID=2562237 RepID=A0A9P1CZG6_9DINO|nr:unnamed protein product [Cladocopium goreaui]